MTLFYALTQRRPKTPCAVNPLHVGLAISLIVATVFIGVEWGNLWLVSP